MENVGSEDNSLKIDALSVFFGRLRKSSILRHIINLRVFDAYNSFIVPVTGNAEIIYKYVLIGFFFSFFFSAGQEALRQMASLAPLLPVELSALVGVSFRPAPCADREGEEPEEPFFVFRGLDLVLFFTGFTTKGDRGHFFFFGGSKAFRFRTVPNNDVGLARRGVRS